MNDALGALIHLLLEGESLAEEWLRPLAPTGLVDSLLDLGVLAAPPDKPGLLEATVALYPVGSLYIISDRRAQVDGAGDGGLVDAVYPALTLNTQQFLLSLPETPCESLLDLCSGTGIAALVGASRYAQRAWSCDVGERCVEFAEFNRRLNGLENVTCAQGDLYQAVGDQTFDRIVAHPPYVPTTDQRVLFRDGGEDGEQVLRGVIEGLPRHLRKGGRCYCVSAATDREGEKVEQRIRKWLGEHECEFDIMLVAFGSDPGQGPLPGPAEQERRPLEAQVRLQEMLKRLKVTAVFYGAITIERMTAARPAATARAIKSARASGETIEWFAHWTTAAAAPGFEEFLLRSRPHLAENLSLHITHRVRNGALVPARYEMASDYPFLVRGTCEEWLARVVHACDGSRTALEICEEMKRQQVIPPQTPLSQCVQYLRELIACGVVEVEEFRLPKGCG